MSNGMTGEIVVAGLVTGTHLIEDIGIAVPNQVAVRIPADLAMRSKDLWRGIQQGRLFQLHSGAGLHVAKGPTPTSNREAQLEAENKRLRGELDAERMRNDGIQSVLDGLQAQLQGVQMAVGKLGAAPRVVQVMPSGQVVAPVAAGSEVVGGEVPAFLPERIHPDTAETQIRPATETAEKANVTSAASKLRELKKQSG